MILPLFLVKIYRQQISCGYITVILSLDSVYSKKYGQIAVVGLTNMIMKYSRSLEQKQVAIKQTLMNGLNIMMNLQIVLKIYQTLYLEVFLLFCLIITSQLGNGIELFVISYHIERFNQKQKMNTENQRNYYKLRNGVKLMN